MKQEATMQRNEVSTPPAGSQTGGAAVATGASASESDRPCDGRYPNDRHFRFLVEALADYAIFMLDAQGYVVSWNAGAERIKGYKAAEIVGRHFSVFYTSEDIARGKPEENLKTATVKRRFTEEGWQVRKGGSRFWANVVLTAVRDEEGRLVGFAKVTCDLSECKRAEEALERRAQDLACSNAELQQFAYLASHELQEPLRMVRSFTRLLAQRYRSRLGSEADEFIAYIVDGAARMQQLIEDLLTYCRMDTQANLLKPTDCESLLRTALSDLGPAIKESAATITHDPLPLVRADAIRLGQVFQNLLANAIKFRGKEPPRVHVSGRQEGEAWVFSVRDNGIGIDPQFYERIFLIFQRLHTRAEYPGTGIGLALCKRIVERHGGRIWVESKPGEGADFCFTIPR